jgi:epimerase transport system membrane fusion protein
MSEENISPEKMIQQVKTNDTSVRVFGFIVLFLTFGVFGVWSYYAPIDSAAIAPGYVTVKNNSKTVQHLEGGIISSLNVQEGSAVAQGDVLLIIDDTQIKAQNEIIHGQFLSLKTLEARLLSERSNLKEVNYPEQIINDADPRAENAMQIQNELFTARKQTIAGERSVLQQRIGQLQSKDNGLDAQKKSNETLSASYLEEINEIEGLLSEGFADKQHLRERQRQYTNLQGDIAAITAEQATIQIQIGETKLQIIQLDKQHEEDITNQLAQVQSQLFDVNEQKRALQDRLERTEIKAPVSGTVLGLSVHTVGGVITPGAPILDIVPDNIDLTVTAQVSPIDIDRVHIGLGAEIRFSSFKSATTPKLFGNVVNLSADRLINESTGMPYYQAQLELTPESIHDLKELKLLPGMPADVLISTGERTLLQYLVKPITDAFVSSFLED